MQILLNPSEPGGIPPAGVSMIYTPYWSIQILAGMIDSPFCLQFDLRDLLVDMPILLGRDSLELNWINLNTIGGGIVVTYNAPFLMVCGLSDLTDFVVGQSSINFKYDLTGDGKIDIRDMQSVMRYWTEINNPPR